MAAPQSSKHPLAGMTDVFKGSKPSKLDDLQRDIWARINQEAQARGIKWKTGDAYCLGAVIKEVLHPSVKALIEEVKLEDLEQLCNDWIKTHGPSDELTAGEVYDWLKLYQMGNKLQSKRLRKDAL